MSLPPNIPQHVFEAVRTRRDFDEVLSHWVAAGWTAHLEKERGDILERKLLDVEEDERPEKILVDDFLWKPVSETRGGVLVVLITPDVEPFVNGEPRMEARGGTNGYGGTYFFRQPGGRYGANVRVTFKGEVGIKPNRRKVEGDYRIEGDDIVILDGGRRTKFV